jgi:branched-chain amino acid transport system ATP-binding protein
MLLVENLQARYGRSQILHDVSLRSGPSEIVCLLGRNGAGKSTTLKCLMGLLIPNAGIVSLEGEAITGLPAYAIARRGIGYVPEERLIFPKLTVAENLSMGIWRDRTQVPASIDRVLGYFPRLKDKLRARGNTLSGGEQQMLSIGRALMAQPRVLLVDEPTEGLAPVIVQALERTLLALATSGTSVLVVESKLAVARRIAARIYVMAKGKTVFDGTPGDLQDNHDIRREYLEV